MALAVPGATGLRILHARPPGDAHQIEMPAWLRPAVETGQRVVAEGPFGPDAPGFLRGSSRLQAWPLLSEGMPIAVLLVGDATAGAADVAEASMPLLVRLFAGALHDFCRWRVAARALRGVEQTLDAFVFEYEEDPGGSGRFPYASRRMAELVEVAPDVLERDATPFFRMIGNDQILQMRENFDAARAAHRAVRGQVRVGLSSGGSRWLMGCAEPGVGENGRLVWYGMAFDATDHVRLAQAKTRAEAESRRKSEFVSRVSHEIRTPLAGLLGYIQLMSLDQSEPLPPAQRERLAQIELAGHRLLEIVNDVLDLSRIEHGDEGLEITELEIGEVLSETLALLAPLADAHGVTFSVESTDLETRVRADRRALGQVLTNLLSNAIKFNRPGGLVTIALHHRPGRLRLTVTDEGIGLTPDQLGQLFTPFKRFGVRKGGVEGTGLGLVIARRLAEAMGGTVQAWSNAGDGATFEVELARVPGRARAGARPATAPAPTLAGQAERTARGAAPEARNPARPAAPIRILYVEDDRLNAAVFEAACKRVPHADVAIAGSVAEAGALLRDASPDLILTDLELPDGNGREVLRMVRDGGADGPPVIAVSATTERADIEAALAAGFADFWTKPIDLGRLPSRLQTALAARDAHEEH